MSLLINNRYGELPNKLLRNLNIELWPPWVDHYNENKKQEYKIEYKNEDNKYLGLN